MVFRSSYSTALSRKQLATMFSSLQDEQMNFFWALQKIKRQSMINISPYLHCLCHIAMYIYMYSLGILIIFMKFSFIIPSWSHLTLKLALYTYSSTLDAVLPLNIRVITLATESVSTITLVWIVEHILLTAYTH